jgi:hypothetical protein
VPVDGSTSSLKALSGAAGLFNNVAQTKIFALNMIEWHMKKINLLQAVTDQNLNMGSQIF